MVSYLAFKWKKREQMIIPGAQPPGGCRGCNSDTNMAIYTHIPAIIPVYALLSDTLGVLRI